MQIICAQGVMKGKTDKHPQLSHVMWLCSLLTTARMPALPPTPARRQMRQHWYFCTSNCVSIFTLVRVNTATFSVAVLAIDDAHACACQHSRRRLQSAAASVLVLLYQQLRKYVYFCASQPAKASSTCRSRSSGTTRDVSASSAHSPLRVVTRICFSICTSK